MCHPEVAIPLVSSRRCFLRSVSLVATTSILREAQFVVAAPEPATTAESRAESALDEKRMGELAAWTALTMETPNPVPFGAEIVHSESGESLMRAGDWQASVKHLTPFREQQSLRNLPGVTDRGLLRLGQAHAQLAQWDRSRQAYERLVNEIGSSPFATRYGRSAIVRREVCALNNISITSYANGFSLRLSSTNARRRSTANATRPNARDSAR